MRIKLSIFLYAALAISSIQAGAQLNGKVQDSGKQDQNIDGLPSRYGNYPYYYKTNNLVVLNKSVFYDFNSQTSIPYPAFNMDSLLKHTPPEKIRVISSKEEMVKGGLDSTYSTIFFLTLSKKAVRKLKATN